MILLSVKWLLNTKANVHDLEFFTQVFESLKKTYTAIELDDREDAQEIQDALREITGARTVPRVFVNGVCLGGGTDVKKLYDNGELIKKFWISLNGPTCEMEEDK